MNGDLVVHVDGDDPVVVTIDGELDLTSAPDLDALLTTLAGTHSRITVDCRALRFVDAAGIRTLAEAQGRLARRGGELTLRELPALARRLVQIVGLDVVFGCSEAPGPLPGLASIGGVPTDRQDRNVIDGAEP